MPLKLLSYLRNPKKVKKNYFPCEIFIDKAKSIKLKFLLKNVSKAIILS